MDPRRSSISIQAECVDRCDCLSNWHWQLPKWQLNFLIVNSKLLSCTCQGNAFSFSISIPISSTFTFLLEWKLLVSGCGSGSRSGVKMSNSCLTGFLALLFACGLSLTELFSCISWPVWLFGCLAHSLPSCQVNF